MSMQSRRVGAVVFLLVAGCFVVVVKLVSRPQESTAVTQPQRSPKQSVLMHEVHDPPKVSIIFVIDSSMNMQPRIGSNYFDLAREGLAEFFRKPNFPEDGTYEVSVIQYAKRDAPGYEQGQPSKTGTYHWFGPLHIVEVPETVPAGVPRTEATVSEILQLVEGLEHTKHFTGSLLESGLREAKVVLGESRGNDDTFYEVILLGTGEYRLPLPCPPANYYIADTLSTCNGDYYDICSTAIGGTDEGCPCNRVCHVRHYLTSLRTARPAGVRVSTLQLGPNWRNFNPPTGWTPEANDPYGPSHNYCPSCPASQVIEKCRQPDRIGFLRELAGWQNDEGTTMCTSVKLGKYARIQPETIWGCGDPGSPTCRPGTAKDIARVLGEWFCAWAAEQMAALLPDHQQAYEDALNPDDDFIYVNGVQQGPRFTLCDNCPNVFNPSQRDCNADGIGDICQQTAEYCCPVGQSSCPEVADDDCDGLCDGLDQCHGGDDCLVRYWARPEECTGAEGEDPCNCDLSLCGCDCDRDSYDDGDPNNDGTGDICQAAIRFANESLGICPPAAGNHPTEDGMEDANYDGIADCADSTEPTCVAIPPDCDLTAQLDCSAPGAGKYLYDFNTAPSGGIMAWLTEEGWALSDEEAIGALSFHTQSADTDWTAAGCLVGSGLGYLEIAPPVDFPGVDATWHVETPSLRLPMVQLCERADDLTQGNCVPSRCPWLGRWSFMAIDLVLKIANNNTPGDWWLAVIDAEACGSPERERVRLRFIDNASASDLHGNVTMYRHTSASICSAFDSDYGEYICSGSLQYEHDEWFQMTILFNNAASYWVIDGTTGCTFIDRLDDATNEPPRAVRIRKRKTVQGDPCGVTALTAAPETYYGYTTPLGQTPAPRTEGEMLGVRLRFSAPNQNGASLAIGGIQIRPIDGCEFMSVTDFGGCASGTFCNCSSGRDWVCDTARACNELPECPNGGE